VLLSDILFVAVDQIKKCIFHFLGLFHLFQISLWSVTAMEGSPRFIALVHMGYHVQSDRHWTALLKGRQLHQLLDWGLTQLPMDN
jgi:hypothetical protein